MPEMVSLLSTTKRRPCPHGSWSCCLADLCVPSYPSVRLRIKDASTPNTHIHTHRHTEHNNNIS